LDDGKGKNREKTFWASLHGEHNFHGRKNGGRNSRTNDKIRRGRNASKGSHR